MNIIHLQTIIKDFGHYYKKKSIFYVHSIMIYAVYYLDKFLDVFIFFFSKYTFH